MEYIGIQKKNGGVVEALQQAILSGQIPAGTEMTQNELAESLGVSRMPVREALMILEYQGLLLRLPNNHVKAADLNEDALRQVLALGPSWNGRPCDACPRMRRWRETKCSSTGRCAVRCRSRCTASCWKASRRPTSPSPSAPARHRSPTACPACWRWTGRVPLMC